MKRDYKKEMGIVRKADSAIDTSQKLKKIAEKILYIFINELKIKNGAVISIDYYGDGFNILSQKGKIDKRIINKAINKKETIITGSKIAHPISFKDKILGIIYVSGKKLNKKDLAYIKAAEMVLDGRFNYEFESAGLKTIFEKYVDNNVLEKLSENPNEKCVKGERHNSSILFADINNFTEYSNSHKPEKIIDFLNTFYKEMTDIAFKRHGTIDKFIGDEIMVVFGSPIPQKNHAVKALKTALEMKKKAKKIIKKYKIPNSGLSVGVATGKVLAGDIGNEKMMDYTVVGDKVNLAARLTSAAGNDEILVDEATKQKSKKFKYKKIKKLQLKGFKDLDIYRVLR